MKLSCHPERSASLVILSAALALSEAEGKDLALTAESPIPDSSRTHHALGLPK
jgi:hypothetical protein